MNQNRIGKLIQEEQEIGREQMRDDLLTEGDYDPGLLKDYGGGNVDWWFDYIRTVVSDCNEYWRNLIENSYNPTTTKNQGEG